MKEKRIQTGNSLAFVAVSRFKSAVNDNVPLPKGNDRAGHSTAAPAHAPLPGLLHFTQIKTPWSKGVIFSHVYVCFNSHLLSPWG